MRLETRRTLRCDVVHHYDPGRDTLVTSTGPRFSARVDGRTHAFTLPSPPAERLFAHARLARRALRLDKSNAVINRGRDGLAILYRGRMFFYDLAASRLRPCGALRSARGALHSGVAVHDDGLFFGEYASNPDRLPVPIWGSRDGGRSWSVVWEVPSPCRHVHGVYADPFGPHLWITSGDFAGECFLYRATPDFREVERFGDGSQRWRPVSLLFERDCISWVMDTQLETPFLQRFDRRTGDLVQSQAFPGPCWYSKQLSDGLAILQTTVEPGPGVTSNRAHLYVSRDLRQWREVASFAKDPWPMRWFKSGVIAFADGPQDSGDFVLFGEALSGLDGRAAFVSLAG